MGFGIDIPNAEYHANEAISKSDLDAARKGGRHLWDKLYGPPRESTPAFDFGTAVHALLPGEDFSKVAVCMPAGMKKTTKEGIAFVAEHKDKIVLNASDSYALEQMMASMNQHPISKALFSGELKGKSELSFFCKDKETGLDCKARPDFILDDLSLVVDLKTTLDASPKGFQKSFAEYRYFVQAAWYLWVIEQSTGRRPEAFCFIAVEKKRPFGVGVYIADQQSIDLGMQHAREDLTKIAEWKANNHYPGYSERAEYISLPKWMLPKEDASSDVQPVTMSY